VKNGIEWREVRVCNPEHPRTSGPVLYAFEVTGIGDVGGRESQGQEFVKMTVWLAARLSTSCATMDRL
jgi:hypothetical protein